MVSSDMLVLDYNGQKKLRHGRYRRLIGHNPPFIAKMTWPCSLYDVIARWHDMNRSNLFTKSCAKDAPSGTKKGGALRKTWGVGCIKPPPPHTHTHTPLAVRGEKWSEYVKRLPMHTPINKFNDTSHITVRYVRCSQKVTRNRTSKNITIFENMPILVARMALHYIVCIIINFAY